MSNDTWGSKPESANGGLFVKIDPDTEVRLRFVGDPYCFVKAFREGEAPKPRWASRCILVNKESKTFEAKVFEFGPQVKAQIANLYNDEDWGDVTKYDVSIKREGSRMDTKYTVVPNQKSPADKDALAEAEKIELVKLVDKNAAENEYDPFKEE